MGHLTLLVKKNEFKNDKGEFSAHFATKIPLTIKKGILLEQNALPIYLIVI